MKKWRLKESVLPNELSKYGYRLICHNEIPRFIYAIKLAVVGDEGERIYISLDKYSRHYKIVKFDLEHLNNKREVTPYIKDLIDANLVEEVVE